VPKTDVDATSAGVSSPGGGEGRCPGTWSRPIIPAVILIGASIDCDYVTRYVGASSSRVRLATPDGPSQRITRSFLPSSPPPSPPPLTLLSPRCVPVSPTQSRLSSSQSIASPPALVLLAVARCTPARCSGASPFVNLAPRDSAKGVLLSAAAAATEGEITSELDGPTATEAVNESGAAKAKVVGRADDNRGDMRATETENGRDSDVADNEPRQTTEAMCTVRRDRI